MVKAKFKCDSVTTFAYGGKEATMSAVYGNSSEENADFTKATPSGQLRITISPDTKAAEYFEPGKEYFLTFEKATGI